jgi:anhydro-N-acetylmuramic acid kinase
LAPKSTGTEYFNLKWLEPHLAQFRSQPPGDIQNTLTELTAISIAQSVTLAQPSAPIEVYCCGGGVKNEYLMERINTHIQPLTANSTAVLGIEPQMVEGAAFAWIAMRTIKRLPGNCMAATGATKAKILGGIYPAS